MVNIYKIDPNNPLKQIVSSKKIIGSNSDIQGVSELEKDSQFYEYSEVGSLAVGLSKQSILWFSIINKGISIPQGAREGGSISWNIEGEYSSLSQVPKQENLLTSTGGRGKNKITSLRAKPIGHIGNQGTRDPNLMSNIPELANESKYSDNFSQGKYYG